jgi:dodecin
MSIAKVLELSAESPQGFDAAIKEGIERATKTVRNVRNAWVKDQEILIESGNVIGYRVHLKLTFEVDPE